MKKLRLDLDTIQVEQFATVVPERASGSVRGFATLIDATCNPADTCHGEASCNATNGYQRCRCDDG